MYVDNIVSGAKNDDEAYLLHKESKSVLKAGGFNPRKFVTNSVWLQPGQRRVSCFSDSLARGASSTIVNISLVPRIPDAREKGGSLAQYVTLRMCVISHTYPYPYPLHT